MISAPISRRTIAEITDALVPALQAQGLVRSAYPSKDLRSAVRIQISAAGAARTFEALPLNRFHL
jgi:hypothetical protein